ncbi:MAG: molybdate ABC transporter substrate-binding protein [Verrucomicrobiota bacterium JB022]|nr:molybdate ABC transporter substrate-binding protein [Verrucomicrobiota bacterium JB022]
MKRKHLLGLCGALLLLLALAVGCTRPDEQAQPALRVFVAASLTDVLTEIAEAYEQETGRQIEFNFASSGALAQQITAANAADVFISASERWMDHIETAGRLQPGTRGTILHNQLVVVANPASPYAPLDDASALCGLDLRFLSIGDPAHVPAGRYAQAWLESVDCDRGASLWAQLQPKLLPAPDVRAALTQVEGRSDIVGIVYRTDYLARAETFRLLYAVPLTEGPSIQYAAASLAEANDPEGAAAFLAYLHAPEAQQRFSAHGFLIPEQP